MTDAYDQFSEEYDLFVNWQQRLDFELPSLETLLQRLQGETRQPVRVLDAACGTGMHAIALAQRGYATAGADLSSGMVARARQNAQDAGVAVRFEAAGFGELAGIFGGQAFDAVLCLGNSLPHLLTQDALTGALADFHACLRPGGLLLVQNRNFDSVMKERNRWMEPQYTRRGDRERMFVRFYDFEPGGLIQFNILTLGREGGGDWRQQVTSTRLRPLKQQQMASAFAGTGFVRVEWYGGLVEGSFNEDTSGNLVGAAWKNG